MIRQPHLIFRAAAVWAGLFLPAMAGAQTAPSSASAPMPRQETGACTAPAPLPAALSGWASPHRPVAAASTPSGLATAALTLGVPVAATLAHRPQITFVVAPEKPGGTVSYGGLFTFAAAEAGTYRIAINSPAWIDVITKVTAQVSIAHSHGPACSGIAKMVDYTLAPGQYVLQISAQGDPQMAIMVAKMP